MAHDGKITNVSLYPGRAEVTRLFKFTVTAGHNQLTINALPTVIDKDSLRVEGRGPATIHDVSISNAPRSTPPATSPTLINLQAKRNRTHKTLERCQKSIAALQSYLSTISIANVAVADLKDLLKGCGTTGELLDNQLLGLEHDLALIDHQIEAERAILHASVPFDERLSLRATIGVFADRDGQIELALVYAVHGASWSAAYDIRVDMHAQNETVTLIYKAAITQNTGEDWSDVSLTLETATPTIGVRVPALHPWTLSLHRPSPIPSPPAGPVMRSTARKSTGPGRGSLFSMDSRSESDGVVSHRELAVSSRGNVSATFQVPGVITVPTDNAAHNVTIVELHLDAVMSWICVPKKDTKTRLSAKIKNASGYTFLRGNGSVYVDGSFISRTEVPAVSPDESFDCPLGLDPSIRVTYHPLIKKYAQSGFYTKTAHHVFSQHITLHNTKPKPLDSIKILDQFPISEDAQIQVKQVSPTLSAPPSVSTGNGATSANAIDVAKRPVQISKGVVALWDGADDPEVDGEALGRNGKFAWVCNVPAQAKVNLLLQWEVVAPPTTDVAGLMIGVCYS